MVKKIVSLFLALVIIVPMVLTAYAGYTFAGSYSNYDNSYKLEWFDKDRWKAVSGVKEIIVRNVGSSNLLYVTSEKNYEAMTIAYVSEEGMDLSAYNEIVVGMALANAENCVYTITYFYEGGSFSDKTSSDGGTKNALHFMLPPENSHNITRVELTLENHISIPDFFAIESFYADSNRTYSYADLLGSRRVAAVAGNAFYYDDRVELVQNEKGACLEFELIKDYEEASVLAVIEVKSTFPGIINVENASTGKISTAALYSGTAKYNVMISELENKIRLGFSGGDNSGSAAVEILSLQIIPVSKDETVRLGTIESCLVENGKLTVKGNIDSSTAIEYINSKLALFKVPYNYNGEDLGESEIEMSISTSFTIATQLNHDFTQHKYVVAIKTKNKIIPLTEPIYASSGKPTPNVSQKCHIGLHNAKSTAVFESEAEDVILDVYVDHLFASSDTVAAIRFAYKDNVYYINSRYVNELSSKVDFFTSIGSKVYFRILTDEEGSFNFDISQKSSVDMMRACAAYIGSHYEKIAGVIVLSGFNYSNGYEARAKEASELLGLFSSSLKSSNGSLELFVSIREDQGYVATMLAAYNKRNGIDNVGIVYDVQNYSDCVTSLKALCDSASFYGNSFVKTMILWKAKRDDISADVYKQLYENADQNSVSAVVLSVNDSISTNEICSIFESVYGSGHKRYQFEAFKTELSYRGEYALWDFTQAYNTFGWFAGGCCSSPETTKSVFNDSRVLKSTVIPSQDDEGILVGWFEDVTDLSAADILRLDLAVKLNSHREISIRVVLGGNGVKAEYITLVKQGEHSIYLDVYSYPQANKVEYIAVIIDSEEEAALEISEVSVLSRTLADDELKTIAGKSGEDIQEHSIFYVFAGAILSSTIIVFIALSKKKTTKHNSGKKS